MESNALELNFKKLLISLCLLLPASTLRSQLKFDQFHDALIEIDSSLNVMAYDKTYIVHFNFCTSNKYCGKRLIDYINKNKNKKILLICDDATSTYIKFLDTKNIFRIAFVDTYAMQKKGIFSVYNIELTPKGRIKKLK